MEQSQLIKKWEGKISANLPATKADEAWSLLSSFCDLHLWVPTISCRTVSGVDGQPGCVRYCATLTAGEDGNPTIWVNEELTAFDPAERRYSYKVNENNVGLRQYVATFKVSPESGEETGGNGCRIEWSFETEPVDGWTQEGLADHLQTAAEAMAKSVEQVLQLEFRSLLLSSVAATDQ